MPARWCAIINYGIGSIIILYTLVRGAAFCILYSTQSFKWYLTFVVSVPVSWVMSPLPRNCQCASARRVHQLVVGRRSMEAKTASEFWATSSRSVIIDMYIQLNINVPYVDSDRRRRITLLECIKLNWKVVSTQRQEQWRFTPMSRVARGSRC